MRQSIIAKFSQILTFFFSDVSPQIHIQTSFSKLQPALFPSGWCEQMNLLEFTFLWLWTWSSLPDVKFRCSYIQYFPWKVSYKSCSSYMANSTMKSVNSQSDKSWYQSIYGDTKTKLSMCFPWNRTVWVVISLPAVQSSLMSHLLHCVGCCDYLAALPANDNAVSSELDVSFPTLCYVAYISEWM